MTMGLSEVLALAAIWFWALVPLFWVPVHRFTAFFRKLGVGTYAVPLLTWLPFAYAVFRHRSTIFSVRLDMPLPVVISGLIVFAAGLALQLWTLRLLRLRGIIGIPEVTGLAESRIITKGPFSVIRHPTYASHTIMYAGVFLITGYSAAGLITLLDILIINFVVIPLEDREMMERFGDEYRRYRDRVPAFFPRITGR